eukprot:6462306-Amphidinium_carterae.1
MHIADVWKRRYLGHIEGPDRAQLLEDPMLNSTSVGVFRCRAFFLLAIWTKPAYTGAKTSRHFARVTSIADDWLITTCSSILK